jgi:hypothetical protein
MAEERSLPGWPKKKLVKDVRRHLAHYGIRPAKIDIWRATWSWAEAIARSYWHMHWPMPSEIGTQYILLLLVEMKSSCMLRLPYRAKEVIPPEVKALIPALQDTGLPAIADETGKKRQQQGSTRRSRSVARQKGQ